jgi:hypothetical protein
MNGTCIVGVTVNIQQAISIVYMLGEADGQNRKCSLYENKCPTLRENKAELTYHARL